MAPWLLTGVMVPVVLLISAVVLPVRFRLRGQADRTSRLRVDIRPFGGFSPAIPVFDTAREGGKSRQKQKKKQTEKSAARSTKSISRFAKRGVLRLIIELMGQFKIIWIRGEAEFGLGDPADTGVVYGALAPLLYTGKYAAGLDLDIRPDFGRKCVCGNIDAAVDLVPIRLVPPVLRFGWSNVRSEIWK